MSLPRYDAATAELLSIDPGDVSLAKLGADIRLLLKAREDVKIALAVRLAIAHKIISTGQTPERSFVAWCQKNVILNGKPIGPHSIWRLVKIGAARNPVKAYEALKKEEREIQADKMARLQEEAKAGRNVVAIKTGKVTPSERKNISPDVSQQVNEIVTIWERISEEARQQFLYMVGAASARRA